MTLALARLPAAALFLLGGLLTMLACTRSREAHSSRLAADLAGLAGARVDLLSMEIERALEAVRAVGSLHAASESVEEHEFRAFVAPALAHHPEFNGIGLALIVPDGRRAEYEAGMQARHPGSVIREVSPGGLAPAPQRPFHVPLHYLEPVERHSAMGFDLASDPRRWAALERARDTGEVTLSDAVRLPDRADQSGIFIGCALYAPDASPSNVEERRLSLVGFAAGLIQPSILLDLAFPGDSEPLMSVELRDASDADDAPPLAAHAPLPATGPADLAFHVDMHHGGQHWRFEARPTAPFVKVRPDRTTPFIALTGIILSALGAYGTDRALARHRSTEQLVRERSRELAVVGSRLQAVLDAATGVAIIATDSSGRVVLANRGAERLLQWPTQAAARDRSLADIHEAGSARDAAREATERLERDVSPEEALLLEARSSLGQEHQATWRTATGELLPVSCVVTRLPGADDAADGLLFVATDARRRLNDEAVLRRARDEAEAASRAKSDFLARMSHELRTPLNSVIGFASVLLRNREGRLSSADLQFLSRIRENGLHLLGLIEDILDLSRVEAGRLELRTGPVDIAALAREVASQFEPQLMDKGLGLRVETQAAPAFARTDAARLRQVLINLVGNAVKFTDAGEIVLRVRSPGVSELVVEIADTGPGIDAGEIPRIFEPFRQAHEGLSRPHGGTGLGLAISRSLCDLHGHRLDVESIPGQGSTFRIHLDTDASAG